MKHELSRPVYGTTRTRVISDAGKVLERQPIYMAPEAWAALKRLSYKQHVSGSEVIEALVTLADKASKKN